MGGTPPRFAPAAQRSAPDALAVLLRLENVRTAFRCGVYIGGESPWFRRTIVSMTLVIAAQNSDYALQVSDRRLTAPDGTLHDDESNKLFIFESDACRFVVGFSGLAGDGRSFKTNEWLPIALRDAAPPDYNPDRLVQRLRDEAGRKFATPAISRLPQAARRMSIMLTGFVYTTDGPLPAYCMITNFQDYQRGADDAEPWQAFRAWWRILTISPRPAWAIQRIGAWERFGESHIETVKSLLNSKRPARAVVGKIIELVRGISGPLGSGSTVGRQLMSAVLYADRMQPCTFAYHSDEEQFTYHSPAVILARRDAGGVIFRDIRLTAVSPDAKPIVVVYPRQPRNQLCKCGSGKKYKKCHGVHS